MDQIAVTENGNSFTALLEPPSTQAMELLYCSSTVAAENDDSPLNRSPALPSNRALIERAAVYSVFASPRTVKRECIDDGLGVPMAVNEGNKLLSKRKVRQNKGKTTSKKSKSTRDESSEDGDEKLPFVHVRARRGEATDSHSLAERARRERINAKMKLLQELVPGCNKISGTALVLDEIINHVQSLQRQVEYLSMRLAAVSPRIDYNLEGLISAGTESMDSNFNLSNNEMPLLWPEIHVNGDQQQWNVGSLNRQMWIKEESHHNLVASENSFLSYDSSANSGPFHSSQLKMELRRLFHSM